MKEILKLTVVLFSAFLLCSCAAENESGKTDITEKAADKPVVTAAFERAEPDSEEKIGGNGDYGNNENVPSSDKDEPSLEESTTAQTEKAQENSPDVFSALDPVDERISYNVTVDGDKMSYKKKYDMDYIYETEDSAVSSEYLKDFFGTDSFPVDEIYRDNLVRFIYNGMFACSVPNGTAAVSPVNGKVIAADFDKNLGRYIALEFDTDKVVIMSYLEEVSVQPGDEVTDGQTLGVCGTSGMTDETRLGMLVMNKI